jgi:hypothetical protein
VTSAHAYELPDSEVPAAAVDAVEALDDAEDLRAAHAALAEPGPDVPMPEIWAEYADLLGPSQPPAE